MLELLFSLAQDQDLEADSIGFSMAHLLEYSEYLIAMEFKGHLAAGVRPISNHQGDASIINEAKIKDLGILTFLALLRIDVFADGQQGLGGSKAKGNLIKGLYTKSAGELAKLVQAIEAGVRRIRPDAVNAIVCLALQQVCRHVAESQPGVSQPASFSAEFEEAILAQYFMVEVDQMLRASYLFAASGQSVDDYLSGTGSIRGEFMKVIKSYLNLIFEPILVKNRMEREIDGVRSLTIEVLLKDPVILNDVWHALDDKRRGGPAASRSKGMQIAGEGGRSSQSHLQLKMFEDLLLHPMSSFDDLPVYAYLLRVLCGKDRYRHAEHVYSMLDLQKVKTVMG